jgi:SPASM domain peptide maturase of grasp-with-spasm system
LPKYFAINVRHFAEAQAWNTCLNRKIAISADGYVKNCPSMPKSFGHISTTSLDAALAADGFKDVWGITKDQVKICRDCEFRYICTDCRAYRQDEADILSQPTMGMTLPITTPVKRQVVHSNSFGGGCD